MNMPNYYGYYPQPYQSYQNNQNQQIQNGGFVSVHSEAEARNYPVAIGTSLTFKDENAPYVYTKTMGFSQLDAPKFDKYRLVKEEPSEQTQTAPNEPKNEKVDNSNYEELKSEIEALWSEIEGIKNDRKPEPASKRVTKRREDGDD